MTNDRPKLSAFVISHNRQSIIGTTLRALAFADEIILVDKSSTDETPRIALSLVDRIVTVPWSPTVEQTRAQAASLCSHDWILFLDDDECLTPEAVRFIDEELRAPRAEIYRLPQRHHILGVHNEAAYYWPEHQVRLFRRGALDFTPTVHGGIKLLSDKVLDIPADDGASILHLSHADVGQWIEKSNRYTSQPDRVRAPDSGADLVGFARRSIDSWASAKGDGSGGDYPAAVGLLRATYDLIDRLKSWEEERGLDGRANFAAICRDLETRYLQLAPIARPRCWPAAEAPIPPPPVDDVIPTGQLEALLRTNAALASLLQDTRTAGDKLRRELDEGGDQLVESRRQLDQARLQLDGAQRGLADKDREQREMRGRLSALERRIDSEADSYRTTIEDLERQIAEKASMVRDLSSKTADLRSQLSVAANNIQDANIRIVGFEQEFQQRRSSIFYKIFREIMRIERKLRGQKLRSQPLPVPAPPQAEHSSSSQVRISVVNLGIKAEPTNRHELRAPNRPVVICLSHVTPFPPRAGNQYRMHRLLSWIRRKGWDIVLLYCPLPGEEPLDADLSGLLSEYENVVLVERNGALRHSLRRQDVVEALASLSGRKTRDFGQILGETPASPTARLTGTIRTYCPDVLLEAVVAIEQALPKSTILANYVFMTRGFPLMSGDTRKILDTHDVFSSKAEKVAQFGVPDGLAMTPAEERELLQRADFVLAIQPDEARTLARLAPNAKVLTVGVDMSVTAPTPVSDAGDAPVVLMVASGNAMNAKGLRDFLRFAWPRVIEAIPDAELHVVGSVGQAVPGDEGGVHRLGQVEDVDLQYARCRVVINPAVAGTGLKVKTLEALAHLRPIVLWPSGVDGVPQELRAFCDCAGDWFIFAETVIDRLRTGDAGARMAKHHGTIVKHLSSEMAYGDLDQMLQAAPPSATPQI